VNTLNTLRRYLRAFVGALRLTLRGEKITPLPERYPNLTAWWRETIRLTDAALSAADASALPAPARAAWTRHIEGRTVSLETILTTVRYHAATEFPELMRVQGDYNYLALQATNINDLFLLRKLLDESTPTGSPPSLLPAPVRETVAALAAHLSALPSKDAL